jgi:hypothetical protein
MRRRLQVSIMVTLTLALGFGCGDAGTDGLDDPGGTPGNGANGDPGNGTGGNVGGPGDGIDDLPVDPGEVGRLTVRPTRLPFGNVQVNTTKTLELVLFNGSERPAPVGFRRSANTGLCRTNSPAAFCVAPPGGSFDGLVVEPGEGVTIEVRFSPRIANTQERGGFTLLTCTGARSCESDISMDGFSVESPWTCTGGHFGAVGVGAEARETVTCTAIANAPVRIEAAELTGSPDFALERPTLPVELSPAGAIEPGGSVDFIITYAPDGLGDDEGTLRVVADLEDPRASERAVPISGSGGAAQICGLPEVVNFGLVSLIEPVARKVTIGNCGFEDLRIDEITVDSEGTGAFTSDDAVAAIVGPGRALTFELVFRPRAEGPVETRMVILSNDPGAPEREVLLRGEGVNLPPCSFSVEPDVLNFGVVSVGSVARQRFAIRNESSTSRCLVTRPGPLPGSDDVFSIVSTFESTLIPPSGALNLAVEFAPDAPGQYFARFGVLGESVELVGSAE